MPERDVILVTGSSGYLGGAIVRKLARHYTISGFDRPGGEPPPAPGTPVSRFGSDKSAHETHSERYRP